MPLWPDDAATGQDQEQQEPGETNWLKRLAATVMVAIRLFVRPNDVRARQESRDDANGHDRRHHEPHPSPWDRTRASARKLLDRAGDALRRVKNRLLGLFDNPIARTARLLELSKLLNFRDMPRQPGSRRQSSGDLFKADRHRHRTCATIASGIKIICAKLVAEFPQIGYNQVREEPIVDDRYLDPSNLCPAVWNTMDTFFGVHGVSCGTIEYLVSDD